MYFGRRPTDRVLLAKKTQKPNQNKMSCGVGVIHMLKKICSKCGNEIIAKFCRSNNFWIQKLFEHSIILVCSKFSILGFVPRLVGIDTFQQEFKRSLHLEIGFLGATLLEHLSLHIFYCLLWKTRWTNWRLLFYSSYHTLCIILCNNSSPFWKDPCCAFLQWNRYVLKVSGDFIFFHHNILAGTWTLLSIRWLFTTTTLFR